MVGGAVAWVAFVFHPEGDAVEVVATAFYQGFEVVFWDGYVVAVFDCADDLNARIDGSAGYHVEGINAIGLCPSPHGCLEIRPKLPIKPGVLWAYV